MKDMTPWVLGLFLLLCVTAGVYITVDVWQECRAEHSFFYCLKLISR